MKNCSVSENLYTIQSQFLIEMVTGKISHMKSFFKKYLITLSANGDLNEMIQNDIFITFFQAFLKMNRSKCENTIKASRTVLFPDMSLVIRYSCR